MWGTSGWGITQVLEAWTMIVACVGMAFFVGWACYMIFMLLVKTFAAGLRILRIHGMRRAIRTDLDRAVHSFLSDLEVGPTMADGGEKTRNELRDTAGTVIKN